MARHNREGKGTDQRGYEYSISYPPDWLRQIKVTRDLESGRQSTKTLFRNPSDRAVRRAGRRRRLGIASAEQELDVEVTVSDPARTVTSLRVECTVTGAKGVEEWVVFKIDGGLPVTRGRS